MATAVKCAAQHATVLEQFEASDACPPLPVGGTPSPGDPDPEACSGVMQCVHVDTHSGAYLVKESESIPDLREGDVLIKASYGSAASGHGSVNFNMLFVTIHSQRCSQLVCVRVCVSMCVHVCDVHSISATCRFLMQG